MKKTISFKEIYVNNKPCRHKKPLIILFFSECCPSVELSTTGPSNSTQHVRLGTYHIVPEESSADRPVYVHALREEYLFYIAGRARGLWMVGPVVGKFSGGLANRGDDVCVEDLQKGRWKFADFNGWRMDQQLNVQCKDIENGK